MIKTGEDDGNTYYHATDDHYVYGIHYRGFEKTWRLNNGRNLGHGLYVTKQLDYFRDNYWPRTIVVCRIEKSAKIMWCRPPEKKTISYLRKEFGNGLLTSDFHKYIPHNKQLKKNEIASLCSYLAEKWVVFLHGYYKGKRAKLFNHARYTLGVRNLKRLYSELKKYQIDGIGIDYTGTPEAFIFNPSMVIPVSFHRYINEKGIVTLSDSLNPEDFRQLYLKRWQTDKMLKRECFLEWDALPRKKRKQIRIENMKEERKDEKQQKTCSIRPSETPTYK